MTEYTLSIHTVHRGAIPYHFLSVEREQGKVMVSLQDHRLNNPWMFLGTVARLVTEHKHYYGDECPGHGMCTDQGCPAHYADE